MRALRPTIGRKKYTLLRDNETLGSGQWVDGEYVPTAAGKTEVPFKANIQPAFQGYQLKLLPAGDREKEAIFISSEDYVYTARSNGSKLLEADIVIYNGAMWKVMYSMPYQNLGFHCECVAIKLPDSEKERITGKVFGRK